MSDVQPVVTGPYTKYAGKKYRVGRPPGTMALHNHVSWMIIEAMIKAYGAREFWDLAVAVRGHKHGDKAAKGPQSFVRYCIREGWLVGARS